MFSRCLWHYIFLIEVAPMPVLAWFQGTYDRVLRLQEVPGCVPVGRGVAAADMAANFAHPQLDPLAAYLQALLASFRARLHLGIDLFQMSALRHGLLLSAV
jgi:hypothetical protein